MKKINIFLITIFKNKIPCLIYFYYEKESVYSTDILLFVTFVSIILQFT